MYSPDFHGKTFTAIILLSSCRWERNQGLEKLKQISQGQILKKNEGEKEKENLININLQIFI